VWRQYRDIFRLMKAILKIGVFMNVSAAKLVKKNLDVGTINSFGNEWSRFNQTVLPEEEARDHFGTSLEQCFSCRKVSLMLEVAGLCDVQFSDRTPYCRVVGIKR
jgi:hypothetical protein